MDNKGKVKGLNIKAVIDPLQLYHIKSKYVYSNSNYLITFFSLADTVSLPLYYSLVDF